MRRIRLLLADDHTFFLETFKLLLEPQYKLVGTVTDGHALVSAALKLKPDVIVMDISMPHLDGLESARRLVELMPDVKLIFLTMHEDPENVGQALKAGASGYVSKSSSTSEIFQAIEDVLAGQIYVTPRVVGGMVQQLMRSPEPAGSSAGRKNTLTPRQREVLALLADGCTMKEAASIMHVAPRTIAFHKYRIMEELGISSNAKLIRYAVKHGYTSAEPHDSARVN